jgi:uncharacterized coiled-coil DUF342 family protein
MQSPVDKILTNLMEMKNKCGIESAHALYEFIDYNRNDYINVINMKFQDVVGRFVTRELSLCSNNASRQQTKQRMAEIMTIIGTSQTAQEKSAAIINYITGIQSRNPFWRGNLYSAGKRKSCKNKRKSNKNKRKSHKKTNKRRHRK